MQYTNNRPKEIVVAHEDQRCAVIRAKYGEADHLFTRIMEQQKPVASTPTMVLVMKTYGTDTVIMQLAARMRIAMLRMDESMLTEEETQIVARGIAEDSTARTLGYDLVMEFFRRLERSEYELYACKPRNIMAAWKQFARYATSLQTRMKEAEDNDRREAERQQHDKRYLRPEEFRRWKEQWTSQQSS